MAKKKCSKRVKIGRLSRNKGASFERRRANDLKEVYPNARRGIQYRDGGKEASDIVGTPWHIECQHAKRSTILQKVRQAQSDAKGEPILVITQENRGTILVTMTLEDWLKMQRPTTV